MIFVTVGTSFPFDRLIRAVDDLAGQGRLGAEVFAQVGRGGYRPRNFPAVETLDKQSFDNHFARAESVIAHAGMGTITMALEAGKSLLVLPRLKQYGELVNDHQLATARRFAQLGHVLAAFDEGELAAKVALLRTFRPTPRVSQADAVAGRIGDALREWMPKTRGGEG